ncbi:hypothetical protein JOC76_000480 [Neobacillus cucumis]|nr:hypothetical protein [Neobacillus cucumis]
MNFNVLREYGAEEAPRHARGFAECLERKSTVKFNEPKNKILVKADLVYYIS